MKNEWVQRYIYAVTRRLPQKQRDDVAADLGAMIGDLAAERFGTAEPSDADIEKILIELGDPAAMADKYCDSRRYLIGPEYFETYLMVLKIVAAAVAFGISLALGLSYIVSPPADIAQTVAGYLSSVFNTVLSSLAWVTLVFAIIEAKRSGAAGKSADADAVAGLPAWKLADLPKIPNKTALIRRSEPIVGVIWAIIALILVNAFAAKLPGVVHTAGATTLVPIFNAAGFAAYLPFLNLLICLGILKEAAKFFAGKWTIPLALGNIAVNVVSLIFVVAFFSDMSVWNQSFVSQLAPIAPDMDIPFMNGFFWNGFSRMMIGIFSFAYLLDSLVNLVKAVKAKITQE